MRVPILPEDLPQNFNKVAKYLGRHWPDGKLGLNQAREKLAVLLGYNSVHEVNITAEKTKLTGTVALSDVHSSILARALYYYQINPNQFVIAYRLPLKELAFYLITDAAVFIDTAPTQINTHFDNFHLISNYKTPEKVINQTENEVIPNYTFAVNDKGKIFSLEYYEKAINELGDIKSAASDLAITEDEFFNQHLIPSAWQDLEKFILNNERSLPTPLMVEVRKIRNDGAYEGFVLVHTGLNAFYPHIYKTKDELNLALMKLFTNNLLNEGGVLSIGQIETARCDSFYDESFLTWRKKKINKNSFFTYKGQQLIRDIDIQPLTDFFENPLVADFKWPDVSVPMIDESIIGREVLVQHTVLEKQIPEIYQQSLKKVNSASVEQLSAVFNTVMNNTEIDFKKLIKKVSGYEYPTHYDEDDLEKWRELGKQVLTHHPELEVMHSNKGIGFLYIEFEQEVHKERYTYECDKRDIEFIVYVIRSILIPKQEKYTNGLFESLLLILEMLKSEEVEFATVKESYINLIKMNERYLAQKRIIKNIVSFNDFKSNADHRYVTHGLPASHKLDSVSEFFHKVTDILIKADGRQNQNKPFRVNLSPGLSPGLPKDIEK